MTAPRLSNGTQWKLVVWGLVVWAGVYILIRVAGQVLLDQSDHPMFIGFVIAVIPLMALVTYPIYWLFKIEHINRPRAAAMMSLPGLGLDAILLFTASRTLTNLSVPMIITFGGILLYGYGIVLITGVFPRG